MGLHTLLFKTLLSFPFLSHPDILSFITQKRYFSSDKMDSPKDMLLLCQPLTRPDPFKSSILSKLPPELLIVIAEFLPPVAAVSFSLSCTITYSLLGRKCENKAKQPEFKTYALLLLLERDLPDVIACSDCKRFHAIIHADRYVYPGAELRNPQCLQVDSARLWIHPNFSTMVFRLMMKGHRKGIDSAPFLDLLTYPWKVFFHAQRIGKITSSCRIVRGSAYVRTQSIFHLKSHESLQFLWEDCCLVCPHFDWRGSCPLGVTSELERLCKKKELYAATGELMQCAYCATEFQINEEDLGSLGKLVYFTRWQSLGTGRRPLDNRWRSHITASNGRPIWARTTFRPRSIRSAFESKREFEFKSLMTPEEKEGLIELRSDITTYSMLGLMGSESDVRAIYRRSHFMWTN